ncbi:hypothetical protein [Aeoliella mucimassa]|nr:hypothetical protein [Aeoliella mucimassa]
MTYAGCLLSAALVLTTVATAAESGSETTEAVSTAWTAVPPEQVESAIVAWFEATAESPEQAAQWQAEARPTLDQLYTSADRLEAIAGTAAIASPEVAKLAEQCRTAPTEVEQLDWLDSAEVPYWLRNNLRLLVGRALVQTEHYEPALAVLQGLQPDDVFAPASLLFYRSVAEHQLVQIDEARASLKALLDAEQPLPERFSQVARLMQADLAEVEQDSLDHIARRMSDVERRLSLGEANDRAQEVERGIIESLDKMIDKLEKQQQQQQQQQQAGSQPSGEPMDDSKIAEQKGEGKVDVKDIGDNSGWGDLPPRERERVIQQIGRDFPGHYRDLMEEYLKRLATDNRDDADE